MIATHIQCAVLTKIVTLCLA